MKSPKPSQQLKKAVPSPLEKASPVQNCCLELEDHSRQRITADRLFPVKDRRMAGATHARLAEQLLVQNRQLFDHLNLEVASIYDGSQVALQMESASTIGAVPLVSPLTGKPDFGVVVQPRFPWKGLGPMLGQMGWRVVPRPLRLPLLRRSERRVPPWVISLMVLERLETLLRQLQRRFDFKEDVLPAPKGTIRWNDYVNRHLAAGRADRVPCRYPDLRDDSHLKGMIRWTAEIQARSLSTQVEHGGFVHQLLERAQGLIEKVRDVAPVRPAPTLTERFARLPLRSEILMEGLEAIEWTAEERGLAGVCDLEGIPWVMDMDQFFEAWVECVLEKVSRNVGGALQRGRLRQTQVPLRWEYPRVGTQLSLIPDFVLEAHDVTLIADAKYKRHFEEISSHTYRDVADEIRETHREDILQVLAYSSLYGGRSRLALLVYPCRKETWDSLKRRNLAILRADVASAGAASQLWLCSIPMEARVEEAAEPVIDAIRKFRRQAA